MPLVPKHKYIVTLAPALQEQVRGMLRAGHTIVHVCEVMQKVWKENVDVPHETIKKAVQRYRDDLLELNTTKILFKIGALDHITKLGIKVDALDDLYKLVALQRRRLDRAIAAEDEFKMAGVNATVQIKLMCDLLVRVAEVQMEVGILPRASKKALPPPVNPEDDDGLRYTEEQGRVIEAIKRRQLKSGEAEVYDTRRG